MKYLKKNSIHFNTFSKEKAAIKAANFDIVLISNSIKIVLLIIMLKVYLRWLLL